MLGSACIRFAILVGLSLLVVHGQTTSSTGEQVGASLDKLAESAGAVCPRALVMQHDHSLLAVSRGTVTRQGGGAKSEHARLGVLSDLAQPQENLGHVLVAVQKLAQGVTNGTEQLSDATREALAGIGEEMQAIIAATNVSHQEDQGEVDRARDAFLDCVTGEGGESNVSVVVATQEQEHASCRREEAELSRNMSTACAAYAATVAVPGAPTCMLTLSGAQNDTQAEHLESCLELIAAWLTPYQARVAETKAACNAIKERHQDQTQGCNILQRGYEDSFCDYRRELTGACSRYDSCFSSREVEQRSVQEKVQVTEASRKAQFVAAKHIQCYLAVINGDAEARQGLLGNCTSLEVATLHLDVMYHDTPEATECDVSLVNTYPCQQPWLTEHYESQSWFADARTAACSPCKDTTSQEPATTTEPAAALGTTASAATTAAAVTTVAPMPSSAELPLRRQAFDEGKLILNYYTGEPRPSLVTFSEEGGAAGFTQTDRFLAWGFTAAAWAEAGLSDWNGNWTVQVHFMFTSDTTWNEGFYFGLDDDTNCGQSSGQVVAIFGVDGRGAQHPGGVNGQLSTSSSHAEIAESLKQRDLPMYWEVSHVAGGGVTFKLFKEATDELLLQAVTSGDHETVTFRDAPIVPIKIYLNSMVPTVFSSVKVQEPVLAA